MDARLACRCGTGKPCPEVEGGGRRALFLRSSAKVFSPRAEDRQNKECFPSVTVERLLEALDDNEESRKSSEILSKAASNSRQENSNERERGE